MEPQHGKIDQSFADSSQDRILSELLSMGFDISAAVEALRTDGVDSIQDAVEFLLAGGSVEEQCQHGCASRNNEEEAFYVVERDRDVKLPGDVRTEHRHTFSMDKITDIGIRKQDQLVGHTEGFVSLELLTNQQKYGPPLSRPHDHVKKLYSRPDSCSFNYRSENSCSSCVEIPGGILSEVSPVNLEMMAREALNKHFGHKSLKNFQLEALKAWATHQDCLVLAATGSGKSLCFQLPALLTGKVVVVISPLISLMHDQCMQLSKCGISACFLGSGQWDKTVERKAMAGMYSIVYVCPETLPRLVGSFKQLACSRGITLFAIDEAHCISKWGHDFRPHYRRLSILKETFTTQALTSLKHDIPVIALTATATYSVEADILKSLKIDSTSAKIVRTTLFRPNLKFSVHHSKTTRPSSYKEDFKGLIKFYVHDYGREHGEEALSGSDGINAGFGGKFCGKRKHGQAMEERSEKVPFSSERMESAVIDDNDEQKDGLLTVEYLENEDEDERECFRRESLAKTGNVDREDEETELQDFENEEEEAERLGGDFNVTWKEFSEVGQDERKNASRGRDCTSIDRGPTIVYMPTRKETEMVAKFLSGFGVSAAAYHAMLPKGQLRKVHDQFHDGTLQVVVATIAFGMGIDKPNVRHIIHYGWPQSLEAYYQEAGRAGRDGLPSECTLYCDMTTLPSLLPSRRGADQTQRALFMLDQCFRYGLSTSKCRAAILLKYFGEEILNSCCNICDVCTMGPPAVANLTREAKMLLMILSECQEASKSPTTKQAFNKKQKKLANVNRNQHSLRHAVDKITECNEFKSRNRLWWRGFGRVLSDVGFLKEAQNLENNHRKLLVPCLKNPEVTIEGIEFLQNCKVGDLHDCLCDETKERETTSPPLCLYPEGDMIQALKEPNLSASDWGRGWADPDIRRERISRFKKKASRRRGCKKRQRKIKGGSVRDRLSAILG